MQRITLFLGFGLLLLLSACKSDPATTSTVAFKRTTNDIIVRVVGEPDRLNPIISSSGYSRQVNELLFQYLVTLDPNTLEFTPQLLEKMPVATEITKGPYAGGVAYQMRIRDAAKWDDGSPVTGHDYAFTIKAAKLPLVRAERIRPYLAAIKDIRVAANDPKQLTVITDEKYILSEEAVTSALLVIPAYFYDENNALTEIPFTDIVDEQKLAEIVKQPEVIAFAETFNGPEFSREHVSGSGPYRLESWEAEQQIVLVRKDNYWGMDLMAKSPVFAAKPDKITFMPIPQSATALAALRGEDLDVMASIAPNDFTEAKEDPFMQERYNFFTPKTSIYFLLHVNNDSPKLSDKRVRQALAHAVDVDQIIEAVFNGYGTRMTGPVNPAKNYYRTDLKPRAYNVEKAKQLLADAGWSDTNGDGVVDKEIDGERVELELEYLMTAGRPISSNVALLVQEAAAPAGIKITPVGKEFNIIRQNTTQGEFELAAMGRQAPPTTWDPTQHWHSETANGGDNLANFSTPEADALIERIRTELDEQKRNGLYGELQALLYEEQPSIFLFSPTERIAIHKRFKANTTPLRPNYFPEQFELIQ